MSRHWDVKLDEYEISKYAFRELRNFCLQYYEKKDKLNAIRSLSATPMTGTPRGSAVSNPTEKKALRAAKLAADCELIEKTLMEIDAEIYPWLLRSVTEEDATWYNMQPPCGVNQFYPKRRRFYKLLADKKGLV